MKKKKPRALVLFSSGLDSRLVVKILQEQLNDKPAKAGSRVNSKDLHCKSSQNNVEAIHFNLPFGSGCCNLDCAFNFTQTEGVKLHYVDCTKGKAFREYLSIVKNPKHGRGAGVNPCIDCRIFILKKAKEFAKKHRIDIIATGEVLGERPMSQYKQALMLIERMAGLEGRILRPLSARLLPETIYEKKRMIDRKKLYDIQGRCRKEQMRLAGKYKIKYPLPAGGCLLCDKNYAAKLQDLFSRKPVDKITLDDIEILRCGRYFVLNKRKKMPESLVKNLSGSSHNTDSKFSSQCEENSHDIVIVGRNHAENMMLQKLKSKNDLMFEPANNVPGPTSILIGKYTNRRFSFRKSSIIKAAMLTAKYSDAKSKRNSKLSKESSHYKVGIVYGTDAFDKRISVKKMNSKVAERMRL